jgi:hypothetical protein
MNRVKFLVFALVALGLFGWSLKLAPSLGADRSTKDASLSLAGVPASLALRLESSRSELQSAMLKLGASNALTNPGPKAAKVDPPTADRFNAVRAAATDGASDALKASLVVVVSNEAGALVAQGAADGAAAPEGFDVAAVNAAGGAGALVTVFGAPHLFYALPMVISDKNEVKSAGLAAVGAPLVDPKTILTGFKAELHLDSVALLADGKVVAVDGDKAGIEGLIKSVKAGVITPVNEGAVEQVGPIALPMMSSLTQELALRRPITGTPFEVLATVSSADDLIALAGFQKFGLGALIGLLLLSIAVTALIKSGEEEGASMVMPPPLPAPPSRSTIQPALVEPTPAEATPHHGPEASPDDFNFPASPSPPSRRHRDLLPRRRPCSSLSRRATPSRTSPQPIPSPVSRRLLHRRLRLQLRRATRPRGRRLLCRRRIRPRFSPPLRRLRLHLPRATHRWRTPSTTKRAHERWRTRCSSPRQGPARTRRPPRWIRLPWLQPSSRPRSRAAVTATTTPTRRASPLCLPS